MSNQPHISLLILSTTLFCLCCASRSGSSAKPAPLSRSTQNVKSTVQYTVLDAGGLPLQQARIYPVRFSDYGSGSGADIPLLANAAGQFTLTDATIQQIIVLPTATANDPHPAPFFAQVGKNAPARIVRPVSVPLRVRFVDGGSRPIAGKSVMVFPVAAPAIKTTIGTDGHSADERSATAFVMGVGFLGAPPELASALTAQTNADGVATFPALPQSARVSLTVDAQPGKRRPLRLAGSVLLRADSSATAAPGTIVLPLDGEITGQVLQKSTGRPVAGAWVYFYEPGSSGRLRTLGPQADAKGQFRITGLYPATYSLGANDTSAGAKPSRYQQTDPSQVTLTAPSATGKTMAKNSMRAAKNVLLARVAQVDVTVRDAHGRPLFAQELLLENAQGSGEGSRTNLDGKTTFRNLPGTYKIRWTDSSNPNAVRTIAQKTIRLGEGRTPTVTFSAAPKRRGDDSPLRALAPDFVGHDLSGKPIHLSSFRGKTVVLDFVYLDDAPKPGVETNPISLGALRTAEAAARALRTDERQHIVFVAVCTSGDAASTSVWLPRALGKQWQAFPHIIFVQDAWGNVAFPPPLPAATAAFHIDGWPQRFVVGPDGTLRNAYGFDPHVLRDLPRLLRDIQLSMQGTRSSRQARQLPHRP